MYKAVAPAVASTAMRTQGHQADWFHSNLGGDHNPYCSKSHALQWFPIGQLPPGIDSTVSELVRRSYSLVT